MNNTQVAHRYFGPPLEAGKAFGVMPIRTKINKICDVLENITGVNGTRIIKPEAGGWVIDGASGTTPMTTDELGIGSGVPDGYTQMEDAIVDMRWMYPEHAEGETDKYEIQVKRGKVLVKDVGDWETAIEFAKYNA